MKRFFGVLASIAVALAFGIYLTHPAGEPPAAAMRHTSVPQPGPGAMAPSPRTSAAVETLPQDIAALRKEVSALRRQVREQLRAGPVGAHGREEIPAHDSRRDPAARAEAERDRQAHMAVLEASFWQEPADQGWSSAAAAAVQDALAFDDTAQAAMRSLECRSTTCRLEMADDNTGELAKVLPVFLMQLAQTLPYATANHIDYSDGSRGIILYMTQESDGPLRTSR
jgi:hypothetical protein